MITLRAATNADSAYFFALRNDPEARRYSETPTQIPLAQHETWWALSQEIRCVAMQDDVVPVGIVRLAPTGEVSLIVDPIYRGKGIGPDMLRALRPFRILAPLWGRIHPDNVASQRAFAAAGWVPTRFEMPLPKEE